MGPGGENSRPDDFPLGNSFLLRDDPLNGLAADDQRGCHPVIEIELALPFLVVNVGVDKPWKRGFVARPYHSGSVRNLDRIFSSDRFNSLAFNHDDRVFNRLPSAAVDQETHFQDRRPFLSERSRHGSQTRENQE
jgi:hypothetical protein